MIDATVCPVNSNQKYCLPTKNTRKKFDKDCIAEIIANTAIIKLYCIDTVQLRVNIECERYVCFAYPQLPSSDRLL